LNSEIIDVFTDLNAKNYKRLNVFQSLTPPDPQTIFNFEDSKIEETKEGGSTPITPHHPIIEE
jgi:hypothetical protein